MKNVSPACKNLMPVSLMTHIPYYLVVGSIKNMMQSNSEFDNPQAGTKMSGI